MPDASEVQIGLQQAQVYVIVPCGLLHLKMLLLQCAHWHLLQPWQSCHDCQQRASLS